MTADELDRTAVVLGVPDRRRHDRRGGRPHRRDGRRRPGDGPGPPGRHRQRRLRRQRRRRRGRAARSCSAPTSPIPDGMPVVWAPGCSACPVRERTTGVDLRPGDRRAGGRRRPPHRASSAARPASASGPPTSSGGRSPRGVDHRPSRRRMVARRRRRWTRPRSTPSATLDRTSSCVALGNPKQERWIARYGADRRRAGAHRHRRQSRLPHRRRPGGRRRGCSEPGWSGSTGRLSEPRRLAGRYAQDLRVFLPGVAAPGVAGPPPRGRRRCRASRRRRTARLVAAPARSGTRRPARNRLLVDGRRGRRRASRSTSPAWTGSTTSRCRRSPASSAPDAPDGCDVRVVRP